MDAPERLAGVHATRVADGSGARVEEEVALDDQGAVQETAERSHVVDEPACAIYGVV